MLTLFAGADQGASPPTSRRLFAAVTAAAEPAGVFDKLQTLLGNGAEITKKLASRLEEGAGGMDSAGGKVADTVSKVTDRATEVGHKALSGVNEVRGCLGMRVSVCGVSGVSVMRAASRIHFGTVRDVKLVWWLGLPWHYIAQLVFSLLLCSNIAAVHAVTPPHKHKPTMTTGCREGEGFPQSPVQQAPWWRPQAPL